MSERPAPMSAETIEPNELQADMVWAVLEGRMPLAVRAGIGVGKTLAIALLLLVLSAVVPDARVLVVMASQRSMLRNLQPICKRLFRGRARWVARTFSWVFETGFTAEFAYYDRVEGSDEANNPIEGADMWLVIIDEAQQLPESVFAHANDRARQLVYDINGRARIPGVVAIGRPSARGWHRRLVREAVERMGGDPDEHVLSASTHINLKNLGPGYLERLAAVRTPAEFEAMVRCAEMPPEEGAVFGMFSAEAWPAGNVYEGFTFDANRPLWLAIDLGQNTPHVLCIQEVRERLGGADVLLDVVFAELAPSQVLTPILTKMLTIGTQSKDSAMYMIRVWPRHRRDMPADAMALDGVVADPAGHDREKHSGLSDIGLLKRSPVEDYMPGLGVPVLAPATHEQRGTRARASAIQAMMAAADGVRRLVVAPDMLTHDLGGRALVTALRRYTWTDIERAETRRKRYADLVGAVDALGYYVAQRRRNPEGEVEDIDALLEVEAPPKSRRRRW